MVVLINVLYGKLSIKKYVLGNLSFGSPLFNSQGKKRRSSYNIYIICLYFLNYISILWCIFILFVALFALAR